MILPIVGFGHDSLRRENQEVTPEYPDLDKLIENMYETMYEAQGVGLAAPQVNIPLRMFIVDGTPADPIGEEEDMTDFKQVFINPRMLKEHGEEWTFEEGCLSIPDIRENVSRKGTILIEYQDENFEKKTETFDGMKARIIQHEYDHLEGILFTDHISSLRKRIVKPRLNKISKGKISADYKMKFQE